MRWAVRIAALLVLLLGAAAVWARLFADGPVRFVPGGRLRGEEVAEPVRDWDFARGHQYVTVESRARALPYSTDSWFMVHRGQLFLLASPLTAGGLIEHLDADPRVRLRFVGGDGRIHPARALRDGDEEQLGTLLAPLLRRTLGVEIGGRVARVSGHRVLPNASIVVYRVESAAPEDRFR